MTTPNIPPWVRAVAYGDATKQATCHAGEVPYNLSYMNHAIALWPGEGFPEANPSPTRFILAMLDDGGPWYSIPRTAVAAWQACLAEDAAICAEHMADADYDEDEDEPPMPPNPVLCMFLGACFIHRNLARFVNVLPAEDIEWKAVPSPGSSAVGSLLIARMPGGLRAAIMSARTPDETTYAPAFESSEWAP